MSMALVGFSSVVAVNDTSAGTVYTAIPEIMEATLAGRETGSLETTTLNQLNTGGTALVFERTYIPTRLVDPGMLKFTVQHSQAAYTRMNGLLGVDVQAYGTPNVLTKWKFTFPDADGAGAITAQVFQVAGFVTKLGEIKVSREGLLEFEVDVRLSGAWTITGGV